MFKYVVAIIAPQLLFFLLFRYPALTSQTATNIGTQLYYNESWLLLRGKSVPILELIMMRTNKRIKFRILKFWVLSHESFLKYLENLYAIVVIIRSVTRSHKAIAMSS
ncbi:uncharacterized protein [Bemisia tabaci]|uniref:uncharacterized protein n=1 Tax=Bemisia tabaci TaxID=7038 RepID=UPI003B28CF3F